MANKNYRTGIHPYPTDGTGVKVAKFTKGTGSTAALLVGSPFTMSGGYAVSATTTYAGNNTEATGVVVWLLDSSKLVVNYLASNAAGWIGGTYLPHQAYRACLDETEFGSIADAGKAYDTTTEANTSVNEYSSICLDSSTEAATNAIWKTGQIIERHFNDYGVAMVEVTCTINPACWCNSGVGV